MHGSNDCYTLFIHPLTTSSNQPLLISYIITGVNEFQHKNCRELRYTTAKSRRHRVLCRHTCQADLARRSNLGSSRVLNASNPCVFPVKSLLRFFIFKKNVSA